MNVLIADDDKLVLDTIQKYVDFRGDVSFLASDGSEALSVMEKESIDLVITDIQMPGVSGFELMKAIKEERPELPVIIITGYAEIELAAQAVNEGASAFLQKPIMFSELDAKIEEAYGSLLEHRQVQQELKTLQQTAEERQQQLENARAFSVSILNNIPFPVCVIDRERQVRLVNPAFQETLIPDQAVEGQTLEMVVPGLDLKPFLPQEVFATFRDASDPTGITMELSVVGESRYFHITGFPVQAGEMEEAEAGEVLTCLFMRDITLLIQMEKKETEHKWYLEEISKFRELTGSLVASSEFLHRVVEHLGQVIASFNEGCVELHCDGAIYQAGAKEKGQQCYLKGKFVIREKERGELTFWSTSPTRLEIQQRFMEDVVEILGRRIEVHEFQLGVVQSERLRSLGEMAAGVAHELNQPLTGIRTFAETVLYGIQNDWEISGEDLAESMKDIVAQVERSTEIIDYMRDFSRGSISSAPEIFHVSDVVDNVFRLVGQQLRVHNIEVEIVLEEDLSACFGHPRQVEQVLLNLVNNARQAMVARREAMAAKTCDAYPQWVPLLKVSVVLENEMVRILVSDSGGGIPNAILERIFEPFFTSKEVGEGTGLGLSISRNIVQNHGGELVVQNHPGVGATFSLTLLTDRTGVDLAEEDR